MRIFEINLEDTSLKNKNKSKFILYFARLCVSLCEENQMKEL